MIYSFVMIAKLYQEIVRTAFSETGYYVENFRADAPLQATQCSFPEGDKNSIIERYTYSLKIIKGRKSAQERVMPN